MTRRQNKTKTNTYLLYKSTSLVLAPHVELAKVHSSPGVIECFRFLSTPRCYVPTFFAETIQSLLSLTTTPDATHSLPLPLRRIALKASRFFWRQPPQDVVGRPPRFGPCTANRPNMTRLKSLESPCRIKAPDNPSWRFSITVWMRLEPVLSRASPYDRGLYPLRFLRRKPMTRKSSLWLGVRRLPKT